MTTTYTYDYQNRLTAMKNQTGSTVISEYNSEYLANGKKARETATVIDKKGKKQQKQPPTLMTCWGGLRKKPRQAGKIFLTPTTTIIIKSK